MLFNTIEFAIYLPIVLLVYWLIGRKRIFAQNLFLTGASYFFYGFWDYRFLFLILFSSLLDYVLARKIFKVSSQKTKKYLLIISLVSNLGLLLFFKYFNFFIESFSDAFRMFGSELNVGTMNIILPVGISFYTFQTLSYSIDVYRGKIVPENKVITFLAYVSFFPQLVAGPIERATNLLPQFQKQRFVDSKSVIHGLRQILWGLFKKVVIADQCGILVDSIFSVNSELGGAALVLGAILFSFQIYGDFSGYSDIAIGTAKLFGFNLMDNFKFPYFSRNIGEFWRRWHISLSSWFRDYLYIPLGGSKKGLRITLRNTFAIFLVSGFWHGANWTFIFWGFFHAVLFLPILLTNNNRKYLGDVSENKNFLSVADLLRIVRTFSLVTLLWIFFRADNITEAFNYIFGIFTKIDQFSIQEFINLGYKLINFVFLIIFLLIMIGFEWFNRMNKYGLQNIGSNVFLRFFIYYFIGIAVLWFLNSNRSFIYFQF